MRTMNLHGLISLPRSIKISVVFLALFLIGASRFLISYPIVSTVHEYILGFDSSIVENLVNSTASEDLQNDQNIPSAVDLASGLSPHSQIKSNGLHIQNKTDQMEISIAPSPNGSKFERDEKSQLSKNSNEEKHLAEPPEINDVGNPGTDINVLSSSNDSSSVAPPSNVLHVYSQKNISGILFSI